MKRRKRIYTKTKKRENEKKQEEKCERRRRTQMQGAKGNGAKGGNGKEEEKKQKDKRTSVGEYLKKVSRKDNGNSMNREGERERKNENAFLESDKKEREYKKRDRK